MWVVLERGAVSPLADAPAPAAGAKLAAPSARACQVQIAGIRYAIESAPGGPPLWIPPATRRFVVAPDGQRADVEVTCRWGDLARPAPLLPVFDSGGTWRLFQDDDGQHELRFETPLLRPHAYKRARFSPDFARGEVTFHGAYFSGDRAYYPLEYPLDELIMVHLLAQGRGVELHACGVVDAEGVGRLFVGASGAGKSTTSRLWLHEPGVRVLSDDRIVVRRGEDGRLWMHGTPWHGDAELARPERAPLSALYLLSHGRQDRLAPCRGGELVARLAACAFPTFHSARGLATTLRFLGELARAVPCSTLEFLPERAVVAFVRAADLASRGETR